jgi:hypothetical protein
MKNCLADINSTLQGVNKNFAAAPDPVSDLLASARDVLLQFL